MIPNRGFSPDVENYPNSRAVLLFTVSDDVDKGLIDRLQRTTPHLVEKSIHGALTEFSRQMATPDFEPPAEEPTEAMSPVSKDELTPSVQSEPWGLSDLESDDEETFFRSHHPSKTKMEDHAPVVIQKRDATEQQRKDLLQAMHRGFSIGVNGRREHQLGDIFSLAVKVSELGLTDNGLTWSLKPADYVVMLLKFPHGYPSPSEYQSLPGKQSVALVRFGKCCSAKPSNVSAQAAFHSDAKGKTPVRDTAHDSAAFIPLYLFNSITKTLNEDLPTLLHTRRAHGISWSAAQILLHRESEGSHVRDDAYRPTTVDHVAELNDERPSATPTHWIVSQDDALVGEEQLNIPLVLMQFALQSIIKSGKFCINCHEHLEEGFEAMKPYVCSRPLCLHQYFSSGFGPGIEHDILTDPYVVDLVISFFYAAVMSHRIRELPKGLGLNTFRPGTPESPRQNHEATACFVTKTAKCDFAYPSFQKGERLLMIVKDGKFLAGKPILSSRKKPPPPPVPYLHLYAS
jgi:ubiquitin-conjugating enzyme E2 Q